LMGILQDALSPQEGRLPGWRWPAANRQLPHRNSRQHRRARAGIPRRPSTASWTASGNWWDYEGRTALLEAMDKVWFGNSRDGRLAAGQTEPSTSPRSLKARSLVVWFLKAVRGRLIRSTVRSAIQFWAVLILLMLCMAFRAGRDGLAALLASA